MVPLTALLILVLLGLVCLVLSISNPPRVPLWIAVFILYMIELLHILPLGK